MRYLLGILAIIGVLLIISFLFCAIVINAFWEEQERMKKERKNIYKEEKK